MRQFRDLMWHWPSNSTNSMGSAPSNLASDASSQSPSAMTSMSGKSQHQVQVNEQGILNSRDGKIWPVLVIRNDMVPDALRQSPPEGIIPVLLYHKNQIEYVARTSVEKKTIEELIRMMGSANVDRTQDQALFTAFFLACEGRNPQYFLDEVCKKHDAINTAPDGGDAGRRIEKEPKTGPKRSREDIESDREQSGSSTSSKRPRSEDSKIASNDDTLISMGLADEMSEAGTTRYPKWSIEQDAELIRLREHDKPDAPWTYTVDAFQRRFASSLRTSSSIRSRYLNYLRPDAATKGHFDPETCTKARVNAISLLVQLTNQCNETADSNSESDDRNEVTALPTERHIASIKNTSAEISSGLQTRIADKPEDNHGDQTNRDSLVDDANKWDSHQDAELIQLYEREDTCSTHEVKQLFLQHFPDSYHSLRQIRHRYKHYLQVDAFKKHGKAANQEECDERRAFALSILDSPFYDSHKLNNRLKQADADVGDEETAASEDRPVRPGRWSGEEDALLVMMREECAETSWERIAQLFKRAHPDSTRSQSDMRHRYFHYLHPDAWLNGSTGDQDFCSRMRARALKFMDVIGIPLGFEDEEAQGSGTSKLPGIETLMVTNHASLEIPEHPQLEGSSVVRWTTEEDAHLIRIREHYMRNFSWRQRHGAWRTAFPKSNRSMHSLQTRYKCYLAEDADGGTDPNATTSDCQKLRKQALAFIESHGESEAFRSLPDSDAFGRAWSVKEDATLLHLREEMVEEPKWTLIATLFQRALPGTIRTSGAMSKRYTTYLSEDACGTGREIVGCSALRARAKDFLRENTVQFTLANLDGNKTDTSVEVQGIRHFSAAEDAEIVRLRERNGVKLGWIAIHDAYKQKFPSSYRTIDSVEDQYNKYLAPDAHEKHGVPPELCKQKRRRAISYLDQIAKLQHSSDRASAREAVKVISLLSDDEDSQGLHADNEEDDDDAESDDHDEEEEEEEDDDEEEGGSDEENGSDRSDLDHEEDDPDTSSRTVRNKYQDTSSSEHNHGAYDMSESEDELLSDPVTFIIGPQQQRFRVPTDRVRGNSYILDDTVHDNDIGAIVTGARWARLKPKKFQPIYEFLKHGDYHPLLRGKQLDGLSEESHDHGREIVRCGQIFDLAREIQIENLMELVCRKFQLLKKDPLAVLFAAKAIYKVETTGSEHETTMRDLLTDTVARDYEKYMLNHAADFFKQQKGTPQFGLDIMEKYLEIMKKQAGDQDAMVV